MSDERTISPLDVRRQRVFDALNDRDPEFAGYYRSAITTLLRPALPGDQRAEVSAVCNAFREIMNSFGHVVGESSSPHIDPSSVQLLADMPNTR